jgi:hypothetical protein
MPVQPPPGSDTGNALTDASNPGAGLSGVITSVNQQIMDAASDCLWPPSGKVTVPFIPGVYSQTFQLPCLLTNSQARAVVAVGLIVGGLLIVQFGATFLLAAEVTSLASRIAGGGGGKAAAGAGARAVPVEAVAV